MIIKQFPEKMEDIPVDLFHPNRALVSGLFQEAVQAGKELRGFLTYIPEGIEYCQPCLVAAVPSGVKAEEYFEQCGLKKFADEKQLFLHLVYPDGQWKADGSDADYINAVYIKIQARDYYVTMQDNIYLCGINDGCFPAHQAAKCMSSDWSGLMSFGRIDGDLCKDVHAFRGEEDQGDVELKVAGISAPLPVWITVPEKNGTTISALEYWKQQNKVVGHPLNGEGADEIWCPTPVRTHSEINEEHISQVRLSVQDAPFSIKQLETSWGYIGLARRHRGQGNKCLRYFKNPVDCGAVKKSMEVDGLMRTWYEFVPECCTPDKEWPIVFVFHGRGGTAETFFDITCISTVAEARKFIAVIPQAGLYQQKKDGLRNVLLWCGEYDGKPVDDVKFVKEILDDIKTRHAIDEGRIYAMGQSSGGMMSDMLSYTAGGIFTAGAPWSALRSPSKQFITYQAGERCVPTMWIYGDQDFLCASKEKDQVFPFDITAEMHDTLMEKIRRYGLDAAKVQRWETYPVSWFSFPDEQNVPMIVVGVVNDMVHANYPEESWISYDQFLSQFYKDKNGNTYYRGQKVAKCNEEK